MKFLVALWMLVVAACQSYADTLTYDDLTGGLISGRGFTEMGYQFSSNMVAVDVAAFFPTVSHSGDYAALNDYGGDAVITQVGGGTFLFINTYLAGWNTEEINGTITGYLNVRTC